MVSLYVLHRQGLSRHLGWPALTTLALFRIIGAAAGIAAISSSTEGLIECSIICASVGLISLVAALTDIVLRVNMSMPEHGVGTLKDYLPMLRNTNTLSNISARSPSTVCYSCGTDPLHRRWFRSPQRTPIRRYPSSFTIQDRRRLDHSSLHCCHNLPPAHPPLYLLCSRRRGTTSQSRLAQPAFHPGQHCVRMAGKLHANNQHLQLHE